MKTVLIILLATSLSGCAGVINPMLASSASMHSHSKYALLTLVSTTPDTTGLPFGFTGVDEQKFEPSQRIGMFIEKGRRTVWYSCPNTVSTDAGTYLTYNFAAGAQYELVCSTGTDSYIRYAHAARR